MDPLFIFVKLNHKLISVFIFKVINLIFIVILFFLYGCAPAAITAAGVAGVSASESAKGLGMSINDTIVHASITENMFKTDVNKFMGVKISVDDGMVLLTGKVENPQTRIEATRLSWKPRGVKEVINEIQVIETGSVKDIAKDLAAATTLKTRLIADKNISSVNFSVDVVNGVIFISGIARTEKEMNLVIEYAKTIKYTNQIVNYVRLADSLSQ